MKQLFKLVFTLAIALFLCGAAQSKTIPIEDFAKKSQFKSAKVSPDGEHIAFTYEDGSEVKLAVMNIADNKILTSFEVGDEREVIDFQWVNNERVMMVAVNITGYLDGAPKEPKLVAGNIDGTKRVQLWDYQRSRIDFISPLKDDDKRILVGKSHWTDEYGMKLHRMDVYTGDLLYNSDSPKPVGGSEAVISSIDVDLNEVPRVAIELDRGDVNDLSDDVTRVHVKDLQGNWTALSLTVNRDDVPNVDGIGFNLTNDKFYFESNHDLDHDGVTGLFELDLKTRKIKFLHRHPDVDIKEGLYGAQGEVIGVTYEPGYPEYFYLSDDSVAEEVAFHKSLRASFKGQDIVMTNYSDDNKLAMIKAYSDKNLGDFFLFDRETNKAKYIASAMPHIKPEQMASVEPFIMTARDGLKMYGQLTIPNGVKPKNLPLIIFPHGGPYGVTDEWGFNWRAQLLANRGYLVLQLNYRGSGGYGNDFMMAGAKEWGAKMQDDLTDATLWAIEKGLADKDRICIHGGSYGGYAAMNAVVKEPDLYKCSIPEAGIYEMEIQWTKADSFRGNSEVRDNYIRQIIGENTKERIRERSPAYHVDKLKAALLIVHGEEDVRVPFDNAQFLEEKLKEAGKEYDTFYREDGHGFQKVEYRIESFEKILDFLEEHIGE
ncbi:alpha/beta hydrolase family protein [Kangiella sp. M94]